MGVLQVPFGALRLPHGQLIVPCRDLGEVLQAARRSSQSALLARSGPHSTSLRAILCTLRCSSVLSERSEGRLEHLIGGFGANGGEDTPEKALNCGLKWGK
jgi:hypothetical protein